MDESGNTELLITTMKKLCSDDEESNLNGQDLLKLYTELIVSCSCDDLNLDGDVTLYKEDLVSRTVAILPRLETITRITEELSSKERELDATIIKEITLKCLPLIGQYQDESAIWSSKECSHSVLCILNSLCKLTKCPSLLQILVGNETEKNIVGEKGLFRIFMQNFSQVFNKVSWKKNAFHVSTFQWILYSLKFPHITQYLGYLIPPALFILDDWELKYKIVGTKTIKYIIENMASSELRMFGYADVLFEALFHQLYTREPDLLKHLFPTITICATVLENDPKIVGVFRKTKYDLILNRLLDEMAHEQKLLLRTVYAEVLETLTATMGFHIMRWSKEVLNICSDYLQIYENEQASDRICILSVLKRYIETCWPRIHHHAERIMKMLSKLAYDISIDDSPLSEEIIKILLERSKDLVLLLYEAAPQTLSSLVVDMKTLKLAPKPQKAIQYIICDIT